MWRRGPPIWEFRVVEGSAEGLEVVFEVADADEGEVDEVDEEFSSFV